MCRYFTDWLTEHYNVTNVSQINGEMFRNYMKYDKRRYGNHPFINAEYTHPTEKAE
ncbi:hypothetical protein [Domibacillus mangrovi]|uniref:hypothetical protein n=1 Tax=Domibacillus mangrovi TaxID=1714354 RepID=UPI0013565CAC|nr:hypothetical protein [Domibacillus mangrovi]